MGKEKYSTYRLDGTGVFRTSGGGTDYCWIPCTLFTDAGKFNCETKVDVETALRQHCHVAGIFDPESIIQWAMETESDAVNPQKMRSGGQHTGVDDAWLVF